MTAGKAATRGAVGAVGSGQSWWRSREKTQEKSTSLRQQEWGGKLSLGKYKPSDPQLRSFALAGIGGETLHAQERRVRDKTGPQNVCL